MADEITVQLVTFNSENYISTCLRTLAEQKRQNLRIVIVDNGSTDSTISRVGPSRPGLDIINNGENLGFAVAHNQAFRNYYSRYVLVLNPDVVLTPKFIEELENYLEKHAEVGAACGKLLRMDRENKPTHYLDSTGLAVKKNRRAFDRGQGSRDSGQYNVSEEVFGCSGAAVLYRREMLEDIKIGDEYFDESFFAYKEDVDLAWRAQLRGWRAAYVPEAVAYHGRGWQPGKRHTVPTFIRLHSFQNRYLMLLKNEEWINLLYHLPFIILYEVLASGYILFRNPTLLKGWYNVIRILKPTLHKRNLIMRRKTTKPEELRKWFI